MITIINNNLQKARVIKGLSKVDLASALNLSHSVIVRAEQGNGISPKTAKKICDYFGVGFDDLFELKEGE